MQIPRRYYFIYYIICTCTKSKPLWAITGTKYVTDYSDFKVK